MGRNGQKWAEMGRNGQKWTEMDRNGQKWEKWVELCFKTHPLQLLVSPSATGDVHLALAKFACKLKKMEITSDVAEENQLHDDVTFRSNCRNSAHCVIKNCHASM